ncbi:chromate transporter [Dokdonia sp. Hel_I_53]|uniref:chromate transporter n=1 Tax=Dokdonia sp. Hel_I_53 TaxID=1566287 RepID=UPI0021BDEB0E|nr:chromate transporter [Dokdonia sp. Hel_I_53]
MGYQPSRIRGAVVASIGIFLPSFLFVLILTPVLPKLRQSTLFRYFLNSVHVAAVAVMLSVLIQMSLESIIDWRSALIYLISALLVFGTWKISLM